MLSLRVNRKRAILWSVSYSRAITQYRIAVCGYWKSHTHIINVALHVVEGIFKSNVAFHWRSITTEVKNVSFRVIQKSYSRTILQSYFIALPLCLLIPNHFLSRVQSPPTPPTPPTPPHICLRIVAGSTVVPLRVIRFCSSLVKGYFPAGFGPEKLIG